MRGLNQLGPMDAHCIVASSLANRMAITVTDARLILQFRLFQVVGVVVVVRFLSLVFNLESIVGEFKYVMYSLSSQPHEL